MSVPQSITLPSEMINNEESLRLNRFSRANPIFHLEASRGNSWSKMDRVMSPCCILICLGALYCIFFQEGSWTSKLLTFLSFFIHSFFCNLVHKVHNPCYGSCCRTDNSGCCSSAVRLSVCSLPQLSIWVYANLLSRL